MKMIEYSPLALEQLKDIQRNITNDFGENVSKKIITNIVRKINNLGVFENMGADVSAIYNVESEYRYIYAEKNYVFYRVEDDGVKIVTILNEKQDFMRTLFGVITTSDKTNEYWEE